MIPWNIHEVNVAYIDFGTNERVMIVMVERADICLCALHGNNIQAIVRTSGGRATGGLQDCRLNVIVRHSN